MLYRQLKQKRWRSFQTQPVKLFRVLACKVEKVVWYSMVKKRDGCVVFNRGKTGRLCGVLYWSGVVFYGGKSGRMCRVLLQKDGKILQSPLGSRVFFQSGSGIHTARGAEVAVGGESFESGFASPLELTMIKVSSMIHWFCELNGLKEDRVQWIVFAGSSKTECLFKMKRYQVTAL